MFLRYSKDPKINVNCSLQISVCRQPRLKIGNGWVGSEKWVGECTYVGTSGSSLVDYVLISEDLMQNLNELIVMDPYSNSYHDVKHFCWIYVLYNVCYY